MADAPRTTTKQVIRLRNQPSPAIRGIQQARLHQANSSLPSSHSATSAAFPTASAGSQDNPIILDSDDSRESADNADSPSNGTLQAQHATGSCLLPEIDSFQPQLDDFNHQHMDLVATRHWTVSREVSPRAPWQGFNTSHEVSRDDNGDSDSVVCLSSDEESGPEAVDSHRGRVDDSDDVIVLDSESEGEGELSPVRGRDEVKPPSKAWDVVVRECKQKLQESNISEHGTELCMRAYMVGWLMSQALQSTCQRPIHRTRCCSS